MHGERPLLPEPLGPELDFLLASDKPHPDNEHALAGAQPAHELLDDAGGRFAIDGETGLILLADPVTARTEPGGVHPVRMRFHDPFHGDYDAAFHLRIAEPLPIPVLPDGTDPLAPFEGMAETPAFAEIDETACDAPFGAMLAEPCAPIDSEQAAALAFETSGPAPALSYARWFDA